MINYKKRIRECLNQIDTSITDEEVFHSKEFKDFLMDIISTALNFTERRVRLTLINRPDLPNGWTDGGMITVNVGGSIVESVHTRQDKYYILLGILIHEIGHRLFTDFPAYNNIFENWNRALDDGENPPFPVEDDPRFLQMVDELRSLDNLRKLFMNVYQRVLNIVEDGYIEQRIYSRFSGVFTMGLARVNHAIFDGTRTLGEQFQDILDESDPDRRDIMFVEVLADQMLRYMKEYNEVKGNLTPETEKMYAKYDMFMSTIRPQMDELKHERNSDVRCMLINEVMLELYDFFPGKVSDDENPEESNQDTSETSDGSDEEQRSGRKDISSENQSLTEMPRSVDPIGDTHPIEDDEGEEDNESTEEKMARAEELSSSESSEREFEQAMKTVKEAMAEAIVEEEHASECDKEAEEIFEKIVKPIPHNIPEDWKYRIVRAKSPSDYAKETYNRISRDMRKYSEPTVRKLNSVLTKRAEEGSSKGYQIGRFDPIQYPRAKMAGDGRTFRQNRLPTGTPSIAFSILIDESGSMSGEKVEAARETAILLSDILSDVGVPYMIGGHTTGSHYQADTLIKLYHDFDEVDRMDKYRLSDISAINGNRDAAAIAYMSEKLLKRSEADKVLIVISDGWPTECAFYSYDAEEDTIITIQKYRKKGINIIGAVVDCYEDIERIYGKRNCLDLTDLTKLPVVLAAMVKRYILG